MLRSDLLDRQLAGVYEVRIEVNLANHGTFCHFYCNSPLRDTPRIRLVPRRCLLPSSFLMEVQRNAWPLQ